jgi:acetyl-CoA carboxylase biotin carboxyl carrier protein
MKEDAKMLESKEPNSDFGLAAVREMVVFLGQTDVTELLVEREGAKLHIKRGTLPARAAALPETTPLALSAATLAPLGSSAHTPPITTAPTHTVAPEIAFPKGHIITSPMVGTYYNSPSPKDPPFAQLEDEIEPGDTVGIIEAMKIMNEIESEIAGKVIHIFVKNGQSVEYGQPIMVLEPL